jgi:hypothetical protein
LGAAGHTEGREKATDDLFVLMAQILVTQTQFRRDVTADVGEYYIGVFDEALK